MKNKKSAKLAPLLIRGLKVKNGRFVFFWSKDFNPEEAVFIDNILKKRKNFVITHDEKTHDGKFRRYAGYIKE